MFINSGIQKVSYSSSDKVIISEKKRKPSIMYRNPGDAVTVKFIDKNTLAFNPASTLHIFRHTTALPSVLPYTYIKNETACNFLVKIKRLNTTTFVTPVY